LDLNANWRWITVLLTSFDPFVARTFGWAEGNRGWGAALPMDVIRRDGEVVLRIDLPGADQDSIDVTTDHGVLTVSAKRSEEYGEQDRLVVRERLMGSYTRKIRLGETVDTEKIEASYDNGVLTIVLPVQEKAKPRKVEIKGVGAPQLTA
jgi:HSP20 family protein